MKCEYHPNVQAVALCDNCSTAVCGFCAKYTGKAVLCERCENASALSKFVDTKSKALNPKVEKIIGKVEDRSEHTGADEAKRNRHPDRSEKAHMAVVILSCVFIAYQISNSIGSGASLSPLQIQEQEDNRFAIESCMLVFWDIATQLANGGQPDPTASCVEAGAPMLIARSNGDLRISHPRPELLGFSDIYVTRSNPVPIMVE
ncbi:MAG: hypothetical protein O2971_02485 [Proteobacteria bacterium]|nr:hypothetical protein [Pseudomonadota bacterium]